MKLSILALLFITACSTVEPSRKAGYVGDRYHHEDGTYSAMEGDKNIGSDGTVCSETSEGFVCSK